MNNQIRLNEERKIGSFIVCLGVLLLIAIISSVIILFNPKNSWLPTQLGIVLALWASGVAITALLFNRNKVLDSKRRIDNMRLFYEVQLDKEVLARMEHEHAIERDVYKQLTEDYSSEIYELRRELHELKDSLEQITGTQFNESVKAILAASRKIEISFTENKKITQNANLHHLPTSSNSFATDNADILVEDDIPSINTIASNSIQDSAKDAAQPIFVSATSSIEEIIDLTEEPEPVTVAIPAQKTPIVPPSEVAEVSEISEPPTTVNRNFISSSFTEIPTQHSATPVSESTRNIVSDTASRKYFSTDPAPKKTSSDAPITPQKPISSPSPKTFQPLGPNVPNIPTIPNVPRPTAPTTPAAKVNYEPTAPTQHSFSSGSLPTVNLDSRINNSTINTSALNNSTTNTTPQNKPTPQAVPPASNPTPLREPITLTPPAPRIPEDKIVETIHPGRYSRDHHRYKASTEPTPSSTGHSHDTNFTSADTTAISTTSYDERMSKIRQRLVQNSSTASPEEKTPLSTQTPSSQGKHKVHKPTTPDVSGISPSDITGEIPAITPDTLINPLPKPANSFREKFVPYQSQVNFTDSATKLTDSATKLTDRTSFTAPIEPERTSRHSAHMPGNTSGNIAGNISGNIPSLDTPIRNSMRINSHSNTEPSAFSADNPPVPPRTSGRRAAREDRENSRLNVSPAKPNDANPLVNPTQSSTPRPYFSSFSQMPSEKHSGVPTGTSHTTSSTPDQHQFTSRTNLPNITGSSTTSTSRSRHIASDEKAPTSKPFTHPLAEPTTTVFASKSPLNTRETPIDNAVQPPRRPVSEILAERAAKSRAHADSRKHGND